MFLQPLAAWLQKIPQLEFWKNMRMSNIFIMPPFLGICISVSVEGHIGETFYLHVPGQFSGYAPGSSHIGLWAALLMVHGTAMLQSSRSRHQIFCFIFVIYYPLPWVDWTTLGRTLQSLLGNLHPHHHCPKSISLKWRPCFQKHIDIHTYALLCLHWQIAHFFHGYNAPSLA